MANSIKLRPKEEICLESTESILPMALHISYEDVTLIWVDRDANESTDCLHTQNCLRAVVNDLKVFECERQCIDYLEWIAPEKTIFLLISGLLAESVLSRTHSIPQLDAVYIFCLDHEKHAPLMNQYAKIRGIFMDKFKLFHHMAEDILKYNEKSFSTHIFAQKHEHGIETSMRDFVDDNKISTNWVELFCFVLIHLPLDRKQAKQDMLAQCRMYYHGNEAEQRRINEFAQQNSTENIIHWYTRDYFQISFFHY
jgi:hypothetical protein